MVNNVLYSYGLGFSYVWYVPYLVGLSVTIFSICFLVAWQSYEDTGSMNVALTRGLTLFLLHLGEWTWMWQYSLLGTWNWKLQAIWSFSFLVLILGLWNAKRFIFCDRVYDFLHVGHARDRKSGLL